MVKKTGLLLFFISLFQFPLSAASVFTYSDDIISVRYRLQSNEPDIAIGREYLHKNPHFIAMYAVTATQNENAVANFAVTDSAYSIGNKIIDKEELTDPVLGRLTRYKVELSQNKNNPAQYQTHYVKRLANGYILNIIFNETAPEADIAFIFKVLATLTLNVVFPSLLP
jgi:hypothetical protein